MTQLCKFCGVSMVLVRCTLARGEEGLRSTHNLWTCDRFQDKLGCNAVCRHDVINETKVWISPDNEVSVETKK